MKRDHSKGLKVTLDYEEPNSILSMGAHKPATSFGSLPQSASNQNLQYRNYSFNTLDNRREPATTKSSSLLAQSKQFSELAEQLKQLLRTIRYPANIKSRE